VTVARKLLLTSAGFETEAIKKAFLRFVGKNPIDVKAIFIPTAAVFPDAIAMLPKCMNDLLNLGIPPENITVFDLHRTMSSDELSAFDAVYFTGGDPHYLLERINDTNFRCPLSDYVDNGGVYVGVSAGSIVASGNLPNNLGYIKASLQVHCEKGTMRGVFDNDTTTQIDLTDSQAVMIHGTEYTII